MERMILNDDKVIYLLIVSGRVQDRIGTEWLDWRDDEEKNDEEFYCKHLV